MTDHAKCRVCGGAHAAPVFENSLAYANWCRIVCDCGASSAWDPTLEAAWAAWDTLMRPAIPEPLQKLVRKVSAFVDDDVNWIRDVDPNTTFDIEMLSASVKALPPELLAACLKETDE